MKIRSLQDIFKFIENEVMPNQLKYIAILILGIIGIFILAWWYG